MIARNEGDHNPANRGIPQPVQFTAEEAVEIELLLWEYDRDGSIAVDNFFHREPELSRKIAVNVIPRNYQRAYLAYLQRRKA
jgi:hypothetical protein